MTGGVKIRTARRGTNAYQHEATTCTGPSTHGRAEDDEGQGLVMVVLVATRIGQFCHGLADGRHRRLPVHVPLIEED